MERQVLRLEAENAKLRSLLEEARRSEKRQAAPFSKGPPKEKPRRPGRKPGEAYGQRFFRPRPEDIDETIEVLLPGRCPHCGGELVEEEVHPQFSTDIPPVEPRTTCFNVHCARCKRCRRRVQGRHPLQSSNALGAASCQIGPNAIALSAQLNKCLGASYGRIAGLFSTTFRLTVARSTLVRAVVRLARKGEALYARITVLVRQSVAVYGDETGWKVAGRSSWLWTFVSLLNKATVYLIRPSRGADVAEEVIGRDYAGFLGRDGLAVYDGFELARHQLCLTHLIRRAGELLESATRGAVRFPRAVKALLQDALTLRDRRDQGLVSSHGLAVAEGRLQHRLDRLLNFTLSNPENEKFAAHLAHHSHQIFTFLGHAEVEATNWPAEQAIRPAVVNRKMSAGNRSPRGAEAQAVLMSIFRTCCQRGLDPLSLLVNLLRSPNPQKFSMMALGP